MNWAPTGRHLIAGAWITSPATFRSDPADGAGLDVAEGGTAEVDRAATAAEAAFATYGQAARAVRADLLDAIAGEIEARADVITAIATAETGLPAARIEGERTRTTGQLRLFATHVRDGGHLDRRHDPALPDRAPPRPDLRLVQRPVGPVAVFGASNFPLAFSTAGGDVAAALAAGCPVVVKGHPAHPATGEIVAEAILAALRSCGLDEGVFSLVQGSSREVGAALVTHPLIRAVGFTGSYAGGKALFDLCAARPEPIPFFGELGSINPMFVLPHAAAARVERIAQGWAASLTLGAGQFCSNPGVVVLVNGPEAETFTAAAAQALRDVPAQTMLTRGIAAAFRNGWDRLVSIDGVVARHAAGSAGRVATPQLLETSGAVWRETLALHGEVFGPLGIVVRARDEAEMVAVAQDIEGQLTCTLHLDDEDTPLVRRLMPILERKAGRVLANGYPTGVEVADAMVHGGPWPASTNFGATSVGTLSIRRFLRPVCYQDVPDALLPEDLR